MPTRPFPGLGRYVSAVGFGTWPLAGPLDVGGVPIGRGPVDEAEALRALHAAREEGISFFDTAPTYGQAEALLGRALAGDQDAVIGTKFGIRVTPCSKAVKAYFPTALRASVEASLRTLRRDAIDVLLLHSPPDDFDWASYDIGPFEALRREGKLRCFGVSCHSVAGAERVLQSGFGQVVEVIYNALDRRAERGVLDEAARRNVGVIARLPLAQGFLADRFRDGPPAFAATDHRSRFSAGEIAWLQDATRKLAFLDELPRGMAVSAVRFCLSHPAVTCVIPGMRSAEQVRANAAAGRLGPLDPETVRHIQHAVPESYPGWIS
jgi:aryl-alcohol dehydrogenase-like predicted oxidoreductase